MKKTIAKTAALVMAAMLAGSAVPMNIAALDYFGGSSTTSSESDVELQTALTTVKKRIDIPKELSEFNYSTSKSYGTKVFNLRWYAKEGSTHYIDVTVVGNIITSYNEYDAEKSYYGNPSLAKLTDSQMLEKAKSYIAKLDPTIKDSVKVSMGNNLSINSDKVTINFKRYENGIEVSGNGGRVTIHKNTGKLISFSTEWWDNAKFDDPSKAKSEKEIENIYKTLCTLTPYYKLTTDWNTKKVTAKIVYQPDMTSEIDAFTGKESTIWEDMREAGGTRFYGYGNFMDAEESMDCDEAPAEGAADAGSGVEFTKAELEKIQIDNSLITPEKAFEQLKKDKFVALTDDYVINSYDIYSEDYYDVRPLSNEDKTKKEEEKNFYLSINFTVKDTLKNNYKGYRTVYVQLNAKTGEILNLEKYSRSGGDLPKLDVAKTKAIADSVAKTYSKNIISSYKADKSNSEPVSVWGDKKKNYETSRRFTYNRYENGIMVSGNNIYVTVDSDGTVTNYWCNHTENVNFPSADILSTDEAFEKLYEQKDFNCYYDGWITKDGQVKTYLIYRMDSFYLNAKTGKLCLWNGDPITKSVSVRDIKYTDIKGIPQEAAILALQRHGASLSAEKTFKPNDYVEKNEFSALLGSLTGGYYYYEDVVAVEVPEEASQADSKKETQYMTREDAAVLFTNSSGYGKIAELKGIFKTPFSDVKSSDKNIGSIAVAYSMGFMKGENGKFNGSKKITRAEAMQMIYDYILYMEKNS